ncbi:MAG TPA: NF038122 family metalloprotease, partial [Pyrinomonadaceae bacterium]|nr:NF038122 family metalloprotease [Pyrinomonadaceae bacterium]
CLLYFVPAKAQDLASVPQGISVGSGTHVNWAATSDRFVAAPEPDKGTATASTYDLPTRPGAGLVITPTFDSSITSDPNSAAIQAMINQAIAIYQAQFSDPITVTILFRYSANRPDGSPMGSGSLARSNYVFYNISYNNYIAALIGDATTANDTTANANLPGAALSTLLPPTSANGRAIGLNTPPAMFANSSVGAGGPFDGIVTLNAAQSFSFTRPPGASYDALRSTEHEIDEVLGLGSGIGESSFRPQDLFSWSSAGVRNLTSTGPRYFSINGGITNLVGFNQTATGDFGDWLSGSCPQANPFVQNAFSCSGQVSDVTTTSPEAVNLDVIGYNLVAAPAASTFTWTGTAGDNNYQTAGNWSPARTVKSPGDILVFNNGVPTTATNFPYPGETIGQLQVLNNTVLALSTNGPNSPAAGTISRTGNTVTGVGTSFTTQLSVGDVILIQTPSLTSYDVTAIASDTSLTTQQSGTFASQIYAPVSRLTISGGSGADLVVGPGSQLNISGSAADKAIRVALLTGTTGSINGSMSFTGAPPPDGTFHRLTAADANAVTFQSGSVFTVNPSVSGNAFGTTNLNSIIFASGSTYVGTGGSNPFGAQAPNSVTVFQTGSLYRYQSSVLPAFNGRTYANFELNTNLDHEFRRRIQPYYQWKSCRERRNA